MSNLKDALSDISHIRRLAAEGMLFRGYGPIVIATTGAVALGVAAWQAMTPAQDAMTFLKVWIGAAIFSAALIGTEMIARSRRHHGGLAQPMLMGALAQFAPAGIAGAAITAVLLWRSMDLAWILPGLWSVLIALGLFASARFLPRAVLWVAGWYLAAGLAVLWLAAESHALLPWGMGLPFGAGQLVLAFILHRSFGGQDAKE